MKAFELITILLLIFGVIILISAAIKTKYIFRLLPNNMSKGKWIQLYYFMLLFAVAYLVIIFLVIYKSTEFLEVIAGVVFLLGGFFVFIVVQTGLDSMKEINKNINKIEVAKKDINEFTYVASHQLKSSISAITTLSSFIDEDFENNNFNDISKYIEAIHQRVYYLDRVINAILEYSKIEHSDFSMVNLDTLLKSEINQYKENDKIKIVLLNQLPLVHANYKQIQKVIKELLTNAISYNDKSNTEIKVFSRITSDYVNLYLDDNGPGIPAKYHHKIFNFFNTLNKENLNVKSGIGLSIVKKIIKIHDGKIKVICNQNGGTTFKISFLKV